MCVRDAVQIFRLWQRRFPTSFEDIGESVASGMVAGEGLAGVVQGMLGVVGVDQGAWSLAGCYGYPC